jgi:hypothetical protein
MSKQKIKTKKRKVREDLRRICLFCGAKKYIKLMYFCNHKNGGQYACKNNDLCVLKMSYKKTIKK